MEDTKRDPNFDNHPYDLGSTPQNYAGFVGILGSDEG